MKRLISLLTLVATATATAPEVSAQQAGADTLIIMTVPLRHLSGKDAVALLRPYASTLPNAGAPGGDVSAPPGGQAVTIREKPINYARMLKVLQEYDKAPASITFTFQLIIADKSGVRATEIASLDSVLRTALKYTGYRLAQTAVLRSGEQQGFSTEQLYAEGQPLSLMMGIDDVRSDGTVKLKVTLNWMPQFNGRNSAGNQSLISTGVSIPLGQTVVLGSAAFDKDRAIILTVRPQLVTGETKGRED